MTTALNYTILKISYIIYTLVSLPYTRNLNNILLFIIFVSTDEGHYTSSNDEY